MKFADELYEKLTEDEDARVCEDIPDEACRATPRSFVLLLFSFFFTKLGDAVASLLSAPVWGRFADASSKSVMIAAALLTAGVGLLTFALQRFAPGLIATAWCLPLVVGSVGALAPLIGNAGVIALLALLGLAGAAFGLVLPEV